MSTQRDVYGEITNQLLDALDKGIIPWKRPWHGASLPTNLFTGKAYRGVNIPILISKCFTSNFWVGYDQARQLGGYVKAKEKATKIIKWDVKKFEDIDPDDPNKKITTYRMRPLVLNVFNVTQCENLKLPELETINFDPIESCENVVAGFTDCPEIQYEGTRAYYSPGKDYINMPNKDVFISEEHFYSTLFHEMGHSTGHSTRLNRATITKNANFGSETYSKEELIAEIASAFLCGETGINSQGIIDNSASYISGWSSKLRSNPKWFIIAAQQAQKASDWILGKARPTNESYE